MTKTLETLLIILGTITTIILAFTSYNATIESIRYLFWISLFLTVGIVIYSGISGIKQSRLIEKLNSQVERYKPFKLLASDKIKLKNAIQDLVEFEKRNVEKTPNIHTLTFPGQSTDSAEFQELLKIAIESTGRKVITHHNLGITGTDLNGIPWDGVIVQVNDLKNPPFFGNRIFEILNELNIKTWTKEGSGFGDNDVMIYSNKPSYKKDE